MTMHRVGYLIGSLAKGSINRKLANALVRLAPPGDVRSPLPSADIHQNVGTSARRLFPFAANVVDHPMSHRPW
jgi:NAD(P)H-dependent FMN reductase